MQYIVQEAAYIVLKDFPDGLTVKQITEEITSRNRGSLSHVGIYLSYV